MDFWLLVMFIIGAVISLIGFLRSEVRQLRRATTRALSSVSKLSLACGAVATLSVLAWLGGAAVVAHHGGTANAGKILDGKYFLGNKGAFVEVSRETWHRVKRVGHNLDFKWLLGATSIVVYAWSTHLSRKMEQNEKMEAGREMCQETRRFKQTVIC